MAAAGTTGSEDTALEDESPAGYDDDEGLAWYAAAAAGDSEEEEEADIGGELEANAAVSVSQDPYLTTDPYLVSDPDAVAVDDPYAVEPEEATDAAPAAATTAAAVVPASGAADAALAAATTAVVVSAPAAASASPAPAVAASRSPATAAAVGASAGTGTKRPLSPARAPPAPPMPPAPPIATADSRVIDLTKDVRSAAARPGRTEQLQLQPQLMPAPGQQQQPPPEPPLQQPPRKAQKTQAQARTGPPAQPPPQHPPQVQAPAPPPQRQAGGGAATAAASQEKLLEAVPTLEKPQKAQKPQVLPEAVPLEAPAPSAPPQPAEQPQPQLQAPVPEQPQPQAPPSQPQVEPAAVGGHGTTEELPPEAGVGTVAARAVASPLEAVVEVADPLPPADVAAVAAEVAPGPAEEQALLDIFECEETWDARVLVVRQGQVHIELQHFNPPMRDPMLLRFCDWLDQQLPLVVSNFPYVRKSGAYVDLSDNIIGPEGLDKLFRVLRDHRVPCVVMKAYRNVLDDSIVDTLIEYLYTQPESFPMHGIHISHNNISDKGAMRLIRAAALCGHYPRLTSRLPLWLRLEANDIVSPQKILADCLKEGFNVCLMGNGLCSRPDCNHHSGVHVQLPYFFHQGRKGQDQYDKERAVAPQEQPAPKQEPTAVQPSPMSGPVAEAPAVETLPSTAPAGLAAEPAEAVGRQEGDVGNLEAEEVTPDWKRKERLAARAGLMVPAPKKQHFQPAPKRMALRGPAPLPAEPEGAAEAPPPLDSAGCLARMGVQHVARPTLPAFSAAPGLQAGPEQPARPAPPLGPPPAEAYAAAAAMSAQLATLGTSPKASWPGPAAPRPTWGGYFVPGDSGYVGSYNGEFDGYSGSSKGSWHTGRGRAGIGYYSQGGKDGGGKGAKAIAKWGGPRMWQGPSLQSKVKKDVRLAEGESNLGFQWRLVGEGHAPQVTTVDPGSQISQVARAGDFLLRVNGLDTSMFSERQIADMLKQRPLALRFGDE